jgi:hypothetical protein
MACRGRRSSGRSDSNRSRTCSAHTAAHSASSWWSESVRVPPRRIDTKRGSRTLGRITPSRPSAHVCSAASARSRPTSRIVATTSARLHPAGRGERERRITRPSPASLTVRLRPPAKPMPVLQRSAQTRRFHLREPWPAWRSGRPTTRPPRPTPSPRRDATQGSAHDGGGEPSSRQDLRQRRRPRARRQCSTPLPNGSSRQPTRQPPCPQAGL